jgi:hypothetical protein
MNLELLATLSVQHKRLQELPDDQDTCRGRQQDRNDPWKVEAMSQDGKDEMETITNRGAEHELLVRSQVQTMVEHSVAVNNLAPGL